MKHFPEKLQHKLNQRIASNSLRHLDTNSNGVDFYSNDYLGFSKSDEIFNQTHQLLVDQNITINGATGSRLISGNHSLYKETESLIAEFHNSEKAIIFNSGYDANLGFFSCVPQRGDIIVYDELSHASIRDGIQLSNAKAYKFKHNNTEHLEKVLKLHANNTTTQEIYVVTEAVFSMDGDHPDLEKIAELTQKYNANLIVDEAHALGVFGNNGVGLTQKLQLEHKVFARIVTFGKALGCHGAAILGSENLYSYLVNFARSFIYTTGLSPHSIATIQIAYKQLSNNITEELHTNIAFFLSEIKRLQINHLFIPSNSSIHCCIISGNEKTKQIAQQIQNKGFNIKPILSPTVTEGKERLRFCLHIYNSHQQITNVLEQLATFV
ncbi:aminotransferase class I/II-fold pyridoxal phosphate-dependent enzyme [Tenacibaculum sp. M341]|uniref:aminotransferase class I/II-fold pyridoxal phosphate-dependent enzyme n=1 Tax=Tenacibaculum sp. M341 TaxID=2530339 RepID=UPI0010447777|nr:pyridoxal phosphate-dependent aminotransferase family protein [Tenacibaculum sp. M341]TCI93129.1 pyridoxal phosphate-dependent aminotransferase family protein [Tenacibaculum sp. M341]